jgi:hypothetical protein
MIRRLRSAREVRPAFTLLHIVSVMALWSIFLLLGGAILVSILKIGRSATEDLQILIVQRTLADQFRTDVAQATSAPDRLDGDRAGPQCLILQGPDGRSVVYRWQADRLQRIQRNGEKKSETALPVGARIRPEFSRSSVNPRLVTLRLEETRGRQTRSRVELWATLGGDRQ